MAKAKAKKPAVKRIAVPQVGLTLNTNHTAYCCGLQEVGGFEVNKGYYIVDDDEYDEYNTLTDARAWQKILKKEYGDEHGVDVIVDIEPIDGEDSTHYISKGAAFATTNAGYQKDVEAILPKQGFRVVAAWKNSSKQTIKLWFKKPNGQKTVKIS